MTDVLVRPAAVPRARAHGRRALPVLVLAGALFAGVFTLRMLNGTVAEAYSMFYTLPVALLAIRFGLRAGAAAGAFSVLLVAVWAVTKDVALTPVGWASRVVPLLLLGVLLGEATDRSRRAEAARREAEAAALLHREAIEINDSLVQGIAAAKWALEGGNLDAGLKTLDDTLGRAQELVSGLIRRARMGGRTEHLPKG